MKCLLNLSLVILVLNAVYGFRVPNFQRFVNNYKANLLFTSYNPKADLRARDMNAFASLSNDNHFPTPNQVLFQYMLCCLSILYCVGCCQTLRFQSTFWLSSTTDNIYKVCIEKCGVIYAVWYKWYD